MTESGRLETRSHNGTTAVADPYRPAPGDLSFEDSHEGWLARSRVVLSPMAAPSIMGLTGFMLATVMVGAWQAGWYGSPTTGGVLWPFALFAGGLLQSVAAVFSFRARDGLAVAIHTAWGAFWLGFGVLQLLAQTGVAAPIAFGASSPAFAFWFIGLTMITVTCMFAALGSNLSVFLTLAALAGGAGLTAAGFWAGSLTVDRIGGWFFVISAGLAWYTVTAMVLEHSFGRTVMPTGMLSKSGNIPGRMATHPIEYSEGMPGVRVGQ